MSDVLYMNKWVWRNAPRILSRQLADRGLVLWNMTKPRQLRERVADTNANTTEYVPCMCWHHVQDWMRGKEIIENGTYIETIEITSLSAPPTASAIHSSTNMYDTCDYYTYYFASLCVLFCLLLLGLTVYNHCLHRKIRRYSIVKR